MTEDEAQPSQLPEQPEPDHAVLSHPEQLDVAAVAAEVGPDALQRLLDPGRHVVGMQVVHQQQAGHQVVCRQRGKHSSSSCPASCRMVSIRSSPAP